MDPDISQGVFSELNFLLKDGWDITIEPERFRVRARIGTIIQSRINQELSDEAWRIARFVGYSHFTSVAKNTDGSYSILSRMATGEGFEIVVEVTG